MLLGQGMANGRANKRRSERIRAELPVIWVRRDRRDELRTADISLEGMFLRTDELIDPGFLVHLEVTLPGENPLIVFAVTRFCGRTMAGAGMGVQFYVLSDHDRRRWQAHYRTLLRERPSAIAAATLAAVGA